MVGARRSRSSAIRVAATLTVITILPAAAFAGAVLVKASSLAPRPTPSDEFLPPLYGTEDFDNETLHALQRGRANDLFASFEWNGTRVRGSYVEFDYNLANGTVSGFTAKGLTSRVLLVSLITLSPFSPTSWPEARGPKFTAPGASIVARVRDDPMSSLEFVTNGSAHRVTFLLPSNVTEVATHWRPGSWPASSVVFSIGDTRGLLVLGAGTFEVAGLTVVARMASRDLLVLKSIPEFGLHRSEKTAFLDAIASGRIASEASLVAILNGTRPTEKWLESQITYRIGMVQIPELVVPRHVAVRLNATGPGAVVLLAFDPLTMPQNRTDRLVVKANGAEVPETTDTLSTFYAAESKGDKAFYSRLPFVATVVALYLPSLGRIMVDVQSQPVEPSPAGLDAASQAAMVVAVGIVSVAAAHMFRRRRES